MLAALNASTLADSESFSSAAEDINGEKEQNNLAQTEAGFRWMNDNKIPKRDFWPTPGVNVPANENADGSSQVGTQGSSASDAKVNINISEIG